MPPAPKSVRTAGGSHKASWSKKVLSSEEVGTAALDSNDPNYDEILDGDYNLDIYECGTTFRTVRQRAPSYATGHVNIEEPTLSLPEFQKKLSGILHDYYATKNATAAVDDIKDLECPMYHDELVYRIVKISLDRNSEVKVYERYALDDEECQELASSLLTLLYSAHVVTQSQNQRAFEKLIEVWEDLSIDVPNAPEQILKFLDCALCDGIVAENFVTRLPETLLRKIRDADADEFIDVYEQLNELKKFKEHAKAILVDYFASHGGGGADDVAQSLVALDRPGMHHEFVRSALQLSFDRDVRTRAEVIQLLADLRDKRVLTDDDILLGFGRMLGALDDFTLDCPGAPDMLSGLIVQGVVEELLPPAFLKNSLRLRTGNDVGINCIRHAISILDSERHWRQRHGGHGRFNLAGSPSNKNKVEFSALEEEDIKKWKLELRNAIAEYFCSADGDEFCRLAAEWDMSSEQAAICVKYILMMAMERTGEQCLMAVDLLCHCVLVREELSKDDIVNGFKLIMENIADVKLDIPDAVDMLRAFRRLCIKRGILERTAPGVDDDDVGLNAHSDDTNNIKRQKNLGAESPSSSTASSPRHLSCYSREIDDWPFVDQLSVEVWAFARPFFHLVALRPPLFAAGQWRVESPQKLAIHNNRLLTCDLVHDRILSTSLQRDLEDTYVYFAVSKPLGLCSDNAAIGGGGDGGIFFTLMDEDNVCLLDPGEAEPYAVVGPGVDPDSEEHDLTEPRAVQSSNGGSVLWVCDSGNHRLLRVDRTSFTPVSVCADIGLRWPEDICVVADSSVAIADTDNNRVVVYTPRDDGHSAVTGEGLVQVVVGGASSGRGDDEDDAITLHGPGAVTSDSVRKVLYIGDSYNGRIVCCPYKVECDCLGDNNIRHEGFSVEKSSPEEEAILSTSYFELPDVCHSMTISSSCRHRGGEQQHDEEEEHRPILRFGEPFVAADNVGRVSGMAVNEETGELYVSDRVNHVVRVLSPLYY
ncbi:Programmed cell death protein 4 [Perkinsus chesapeaki]|uniref:Programmed cell death protein 4 n=1 Tax=Perkinsus chesapeaki TaxID=330153 RepID=A0A7J6M6R9_PERCH|nr:Programmed cell death protein 4 [Perkinsus chesapeaki]